jgi:hypothetical protein
MMLELDAAPRLAERPERMDVAIARTAPVAKLDPDFEGRAGRPHELGFVKPEHIVELFDVRKRRLANADGPDLIGFNERNIVGVSRQPMRQAGSGHPAGGAAAKNYDAKLAVTFPGFHELYQSSPSKGRTARGAAVRLRSSFIRI